MTGQLEQEDPIQAMMMSPQPFLNPLQPSGRTQHRFPNKRQVALSDSQTLPDLTPEQCCGTESQVNPNSRQAAIPWYDMLCSCIQL